MQAPFPPPKILIDSDLLRAYPIGIGASQGWVPYVQVDDVDRATERAINLGAKVLQKRTRGPAGEFTIVLARAAQEARIMTHVILA